MKNQYMHIMTKEEKWEELQALIGGLEENDPLDDEERAMLADWKSIKFEDLKDETKEEFKARQKEFKACLKAQKEYRKEQKKLRKSKQITIRCNGEVIDKIKQKAADYGMNYQTYINTFLYQLAQGNLSIELK